MTLGLMAAPLLMGIAGPRLGWRGSFVISGALGLVWAAVWLITARRVPSSIGPASAGTRVDMTLLRDRRLWLITIASALVMTVPSLWTNWTTIYFVQEHHLSLVDANRQFAWIPPLFATIGAFVGGSLAFRKIGRDGDAVQARFAICKAMAPLLLGTAAAPFVSSTTLAALAIAVGFGASMAIANNLQMIPVGVFGPERAAFTGAVLTCSFALMQTLVSPFIGVAIDSYGFAVVCVTMSALSLLGVLTLAVALRGERDASPRVAVFAARQAAPTADGVGQ